MSAPKKDDLDTSWSAIASTQLGQLVDLFGPNLPGNVAARWLAFWGRQAERLKESLGRIRVSAFERAAVKASDEILATVSQQRAIMESHSRLPATLAFGVISQFAARLDTLRDRAIKEDDDPPVTFPKKFAPADFGVVAPTAEETLAAKKAKEELEAERRKKPLISTSTAVLLGIAAAVWLTRR